MSRRIWLGILVGPGLAAFASAQASSAGSSSAGTALIQPIPYCANWIEDQSTGDCLMADTTPTLDRLYPLSASFNVAPGTGNVGLGTTAPIRALQLSRSNAHVVQRIEALGASHGEANLEFKTASDPVAWQIFMDDVSLNHLGSADALGFYHGRLGMKLRNGLGTEMELYDFASMRTVLLNSKRSDPSGSLGGASLEFEGDTGVSTVELTGYSPQSGNQEGGTLLLRRASSAPTWAEVQIVSDYQGAGGGIMLSEPDASTSCWLAGTGLYTFNNSAGTPTISFDRQNGTKNAVVDTPSHGQRLLYCMESPEVWFEDFGSARLEDGAARVRLDPVFLETVTIDNGHPMKVFVTPNAETPGLWVEKALDHFVVREQKGGTGRTAFDWRVVAKRKGLESLRLEPFTRTP